VTARALAVIAVVALGGAAHAQDLFGSPDLPLGPPLTVQTRGMLFEDQPLGFDAAGKLVYQPTGSPISALLYICRGATQGEPNAGITNLLTEPVLPEGSRLDRVLQGFTYDRARVVAVSVGLDGALAFKIGGCADAPTPTNPTLVDPDPVQVPLAASAAAGRRLDRAVTPTGFHSVAMSPSGRLCLPFDDGVYCLDSAAPSPALDLVLPHATIAAALGPAPEWLARARHVDDQGAPLPLDWHVSTATFAAEDLIVLVEERATRLRWIVARAPDGALRRLMGPVPFFDPLRASGFAYPSPLQEWTGMGCCGPNPQRLVFDPELDAVLVYPVRNWTFGAYLEGVSGELVNEGLPTPACPPGEPCSGVGTHGFDGIGARVVPLTPALADHPETGYLDLTPLASHALVCPGLAPGSCPGITNHFDLLSGAPGEYRVMLRLVGDGPLRLGPGAVRHTARLSRLPAAPRRRQLLHLHRLSRAVRARGPVRPRSLGRLLPHRARDRAAGRRLPRARHRRPELPRHAVGGGRHVRRHEPRRALGRRPVASPAHALGHIPGHLLALGTGARARP